MRGNGNGTSLEHRTLAELMALKADIEAAISAKREAERQTRQALIELAQSRGFDAKELLLGPKGNRPVKASASATKTHKGAKPAKYRDPAHPEQTWSGYGKAPAWLLKLTKGGTSREAFQIR